MDDPILSRNTRSQYNSLLDALILQHEDDGQDAIIFVQTDRETEPISRRQFRLAARKYGAALLKLGIKPRDIVVIAHTQSIESIYAFWGAMLAGAIPSMFPTLTEKLDPEIYMRNMAELVQISAVRAVLTTDSFAPVLDSQVGCPVYGSSELEAIAGDIHGLEFDLRRDPGQIAFLQHSSGTTGLQKGVALSHRAVLNQLANYSDAINLSQNDVIVSWLPLYHDMGLIAGFMLPLVQGVPLVLMSPFDWVRHPALLLRAIHEHQGTLCWLPNFAYNHSARRIRPRDRQKYSLASMRLFINCSEPVRHHSHQLFLDKFTEIGIRPEMLAVSYAMAENTFGVSQTVPGAPALLDIIDGRKLEEQGMALPVPVDHPQAATKVSCGPPIPGTEIRVVSNDNQNPLNHRQVGEVAIRSDCMLTEYYNRPDLQPFQDGWFLTGDRGYISDDEIYIIGRSKDMIINAGKNIYPQDIEAIVNELPGIHAGRAVVFGVPDRKEGTELIAVVAEVSSTDAGERQQISKRIRLEVSRQSMVTVNFVELVDPKWLVKTSSGKIARAANRDKWLSQRRLL